MSLPIPDEQSINAFSRMLGRHGLATLLSIAFAVYVVWTNERHLQDLKTKAETQAEAIKDLNGQLIHIASATTDHAAANASALNTTNQILVQMCINSARAAEQDWRTCFRTPQP